jgi:hypothetical protein
VALAQESPAPLIRTLRAEGTADARFPVALRASRPVTFTFDVTDDGQPNLHVRVWHCDRNWRRTESVFVNDPARNMSVATIPSVRAPQGVQGYRWVYSFKLPGFTGLERFTYSGNYVAEIVNADGNDVLASVRFFVAESIVSGAVRVGNRQLPSESAPWNEVLRVAFPFTVPTPAPTDEAPISPLMVRTMDVYRNRELYRPFRVDLDERKPETFVDGFGTNSLRFILDNAPAGNEYRTIDLRSADKYPLGDILRRQEGADVSRWQTRAPSDQNGFMSLVNDGRHADYVPFRFEILRTDDAPDEDIRVAGEFNGWSPTEEWRMAQVPGSKRYTLLAHLRRGIHDYQYVLNGADWLSLEGNDWRTVSVYTAFMYYRDPRFGGYDRILIAGQGRSPGGTDATVR